MVNGKLQKSKCECINNKVNLFHRNELITSFAVNNDLLIKKKKLHGLSPRANYTNRATAACRQSDCQLFADRGCHVVSVTDPYSPILGFLDRSRYFFYEVAPQLYSRG
jgi:hypothetical protein